MRGWQRLVGDAEPAVEAIVGFLEHAEAVCLLVCALDARLDSLARFVCAHPYLLLLGDDAKKRASVLHCAAAHGRVGVVQAVLRHRCMRLTRSKRDGALRGNGARADGAAVASTASVQPFTVSDAQHAADARFAVMAWVNRNVPYVFPGDVMYEAARQGDLHVVMWLHTTAQYEVYRAMEFAASKGHLEIAQWLYDHRRSALSSSPASSRTSTSTATQIYLLVPLSSDDTSDDNSTDVMNWIAVFARGKFFREALATRKGLFGAYDQRDDGGIDWDDAVARDAAFSQKRFKAIDLAATNGDLELAKKLHAGGRHWACTSQAMDGAARMGHLDVVQWLHKNRTEGCTSNAIAAAAGNGHFGVAQWLKEHRFEGCRSYAMDLSATHGHLQILQWLYQEYPRFSCTQPFVPCVAANNHRHVLRWLHKEKGFALDLRTVEAAIANGHLGLVQWLLQQEPSLEQQLTASVVAKAARSGNAALTQWLVRDKMLWSSRALANAAVRGNLELVKWLHSCGKASEPVSASDLFDLAHKHEFGLVEWLLQHQLAIPQFTRSQKEFTVLFGGSITRQAAALERSKAQTAASSSSSSSHFVWDMHTKENPSWIAKYTLLVMKYHPTFLLSIDSSPILAAQRGELRVLQRLAAVGHPEVFTKQTFHALLMYTKAGDAMQWFLKTSGFAFVNASVVEWAAKFKLLGCLECCFAHVETMDERFQVHACETTMRTACRHGHLDLLRWSSSKLERIAASPISTASTDSETATESTTVEANKMRTRKDLWSELSVEAAANGHVEVLKWISSECSHVLSSQVQVQQLVDAAAANGQLRVLEWFSVSQVEGGACLPVSRDGIENALANKHFDVVQWLVERDLAVVNCDQELRNAIAACLESELDGFVPSRTGIPCVLPPI